MADKLSVTQRRFLQLSIDEKKEYIEERTRNCRAVERSEYPEMIGERICFLRAGIFHNGGYVWYKKQNKGRWFFMIGAFPNVNFKNFHYALYWDTIDLLWKKMGPDTTLLRRAVDDRRADIEDIAAFLLQRFGREFSDFLLARRAKKQPARLPSPRPVARSDSELVRRHGKPSTHSDRERSTVPEEEEKRSDGEHSHRSRSRSRSHSRSGRYSSSEDH